MSDFSDMVEASVLFSETEDSSAVDFTDIGDFGQIIIQDTVRFGEGEFGAGGFGGDIVTIIIDIPETDWTNIETP